MDYFNARWYDSALGRFAQADSIVPLASQGAQAWDRYAFVNNNALKYNDPSGHMICDEERGCEGQVVDEFQLKLGRSYQGKCWGAEDCLRGAKLWENSATWSINYGGQVFAMLGFRGGISMAVDGQGNLGVFVGGGGGGYVGIGANLGLSVTHTNAPAVSDLEGLSAQLGVNAGLGDVVTYEQIYFEKNGENYEGQTLGGGLMAPLLAEGHATVEYDVPIVQFNLFDAIIKLVTTW